MDHEKTMLNVDSQVKHLKDKGITFLFFSEEKAKIYLRNNNYYFKLTSYRKNYKKYEDGVNDGKYISLDFGYLKDLASIDMELRYMLAQLSFDIEHYTKIELLRLAEDFNEDGYKICNDFIDSLNENQKEKLINEIERNKDSIYCRDLFLKYHMNFPMWVFLELIPFGRLVSFYGFCANRYNDKKMNERFYMLKTCKEIRNAAAHSSCIINDLNPKTTKYKTSYAVLRDLSKIEYISKQSRNKRMSNVRIQQIVTLLYMYNNISSQGIHKKALMLLENFKKRILKNFQYFQDNEIIKINFEFLILIIDNWYLGAYTCTT